MGLKDLFKKGVDAVVSIKEKATQAMADYKQMVAEVETEAGQWKTFDPDFLRAVLDGRLAAAYDLYVAKTGASPAKAKMLVKKIRPNVVRVYPGILKAQAMETIKNIWPYGMNRLLAFRKSEKEEYTYEVGYVRICPTIDAKFYFSAEFWNDGSVETIEYAITFNNGSMILKKDDVIIEVKDNKAGTINFNENDPEYVKCKAAYEVWESEQNFTVFSTTDIEKVKNGDVRKDAMLAAGTKYKFSFQKEGDYKYLVKTEGLNIAELVRDWYFKYYRWEMACDIVCSVSLGMDWNCTLSPWESELFFKAYKNVMDTGGDLGAMYRVYRHQVRKQCLDGLPNNINMSKQEERLFVYNHVQFPATKYIGIKEENGEIVTNGLWPRNAKGCEELYNTFKPLVAKSCISVRPATIVFGQQSKDVTLHIKFDIIKNQTVIRNSLKKAFEDEPRKKFPRAEIVLEYASNSVRRVRLYDQVFEVL